MLGSSVDPTLYWLRAFRRQEEYYNSRVRDETPNSIRKRLAALAAEVGADEDQVLKLISWTGESINSGTGVTIDTKYHMIGTRLSACVANSDRTVFTLLPQPY